MQGLNLFIVILTAFVGITYQDKVPVLIWSNDRSLVLPHPLAGHTISRTNFIQNYLNVIPSDGALNVVLFIQDELNLKDITQNAAVYDTDEEGNDALRQLKEIMSSMSVAELPSVDSPLSAIAELKNRFPVGSVHELQPPYNIENLALSQSSHNLLLLRLPKLETGDSTYRKYLQNIDDIVGSVTSQVKKLLTPFVAVYTAAASSSQEKGNRWSNMALKRAGRQLLQSNAPPTNLPGLIANVSGMFMMYATNITLVYGTQMYQLDTNYLWGMDSTGCSNSSINCTVIMTQNNGSNDFHLTISSVQTTGSNGGYWYVNSMSVNSSTTGGVVSFNPGFMELTPVGYSWHCYPSTNVSALNASYSTNGEYWTISFVDLQIQAFGLYPGQGFGYYNDCTCFFTIAIWMGIIAGAVMLAILLFGICMLMDIKTMDRFDDPKGKTITVAAAD